MGNRQKVVYGHSFAILYGIIENIVFLLDIPDIEGIFLFSQHICYT